MFAEFARGEIGLEWSEPQNWQFLGRSFHGGDTRWEYLTPAPRFVKALPHRSRKKIRKPRHFSELHRGICSLSF